MPTLQALHEVAPSIEVKNPTSQSWHEVAPSLPAKKPAVQPAQAVDTEYWPALQMSQLVRPASA
jgi:hypothetical protein